MWSVLVPYVHQMLVFGGIVIEPWEWWQWWPFLSAF
jgi:hypothetical protein